MPTDTIAHFIFVDLENVPDVDLELGGGKPVHVTLLIGKHQKRLELPLVHQIHRLASQVTLIEVGATGHNALDLTLACYLGQAIQQWPAAQFHIVSKDRDFEPMIAHLVARGSKVARCDTFHHLPFLAPAKPLGTPKRSTPAKAVAVVAEPKKDKSAKVFARLATPNNRNRPTTEKALRAHIRTALGKESTDAKIEDVLRELRDRNVLTIASGGKVDYTVAQ